MPPRARSLVCALAIGLLGACVASSAESSDPGGGGGGKADGPGCEYLDLIEEARVILAELDPFYRDGSWSDRSARIERIGDLNGDRYDDVIVMPGLQYAGANEEMVIYLTVGDTPCGTRFAGNAAGVGIEPAPTGAIAGHRDLRVTNTSACETEIRRYTYNETSQHYVATDEAETQNLCR